MKKEIFIILIIFHFFPFLSEAQSDCNRSVKESSYASMLPTNFCMLPGYIVMGVFQVDINRDGVQDRIIKYHREKWIGIDTVHIAVYLGKSNPETFKCSKTFSNLCTPIFADSVGIESVWPDIDESGKRRIQYMWDNSSWISFRDGIITVAFATDMWSGVDFHFEYNHKKENWFLTKLQRWRMIEKRYGYEREYADSKLENVHNGICIEDFKMEDYLKG